MWAEQGSAWLALQHLEDRLQMLRINTAGNRDPSSVGEMDLQRHRGGEGDGQKHFPPQWVVLSPLKKEQTNSFVSIPDRMGLQDNEASRSFIFP